MFDSNDSGAVFSDCRKYRYVLWRKISEGDRICAFVGLNPSTTDEHHNDPTVSKCLAFAKSWGYSGFMMLNLFAFRATDPLEMKANPLPVGTDNDEWISKVSSLSHLVVVAWGNHGVHLGRDNEVLLLLKTTELMCLAKNRTGCPKHPLYISGSKKLERF